MNSHSQDSFIRHFLIFFDNFRLTRDTCKLYISLIGILILSLAIGGKNVSKFELASNVYLIDFSFLLLAAYALLATKVRFIWPIYYLSFLAILAILVHSYTTSNAPLNITLRQFAPFTYAMTSYLVCGYVIQMNRENEFRDVIVSVSAWSVVIQIVYIAFLFLVGQYSNFNYASPLVICGIIIWASYAFVYKTTTRYLSWFCSLVLIATTGHASATLCIFAIPFSYHFLKAQTIYRTIILVIFIGMMLIATQIPEIFDTNAYWRIVYWEDAIRRIFSEGNWLLGFGFGELYANENTRDLFIDYFNSANDLNDFDEGYYKAFHNSYITLLFHTGIISAVFFMPQIKAFFSPKAIYENNDTLFMSVALFSLTIWTALNVVLELPHSAHFYWLFAFMCYHYNLKNIRKWKNEL